MTREAKQASAFVKRKINSVTGTKSESATRAILARLRRGIGKAPGSLPDLWDVTLGGLPEELFSKDEEPTYSEWAVHTALTLYALHQQGKNFEKQIMSIEGAFLGTAVRRLVESDHGNEDAVTRRFHAVAVSESFERLSWHLRGLVQLLRSKDIPLDYAALTEDLYWFQFQDRRDDIRLKWGQDFYRVKEAINDKNKTVKENSIDGEQ